MDSFPYEEPDIRTILVLSSFLLLLNLVNFVLNKSIYCGLLGQILIGIAWGSPGAGWLDNHAEKMISELGYLGLLLLVYEGGLSTSFPSLTANLALSVGVAATGIATPIVLSLVLHNLLGATYLQSFAAGAALCSTSLGTTFTVLSASGLSNTRLGSVLTSAAMMDDIVGLVMVQVISSLGSIKSFHAEIVIRPVFVSAGFAIIIPLLCWLIVLPVTKCLNGYRETKMPETLQKVLSSHPFTPIIQILLLVGMCAAGSYAGTSNLFTVYLAGACMSWWDTEVPHLSHSTETNHAQSLAPHSGLKTYEQNFQPGVERILKPFFFASIGFSIPIRKMFTGQVIWKGLVFTLLMIIGKIICGMWLLRISFSLNLQERLRRYQLKLIRLLRALKIPVPRETENPIPPKADVTVKDSQTPPSRNIATENSSKTMPEKLTMQRNFSKKPLSLYPGAILGSAMVARGEIGFLISSLAESRDIFSSSPSEYSDTFLVVTWAITLCTILGPLAVGFLVRRVRTLEQRSAAAQPEGSKDVLGEWGVQ